MTPGSGAPHSSIAPAAPMLYAAHLLWCPATTDSVARATNVREVIATRFPRLPDMAIKRMDHVGVVVDDLAAATAFFVELGLKLEAQPSAEVPSVDPVPSP